MNIKSITIDNVRGFEHWTLEQAILPNRPNILVAPNGFGKSSIATAFASLSGNRIEVLEVLDILNGIMNFQTIREPLLHYIMTIPNKCRAGLKI